MKRIFIFLLILLAFTPAVSAVNTTASDTIQMSYSPNSYTTSSGYSQMASFAVTNTMNGSLKIKYTAYVSNSGAIGRYVLYKNGVEVTNNAYCIDITSTTLTEYTYTWNYGTLNPGDTVQIYARKVSGTGGIYLNDYSLSWTESANAIVRVWIVSGSGNVYAYANGNPMGYIQSSEGNKQFNFNMSDTFSFNAIANTDWHFTKFCGTWGCSINTTSNPFTGTITASYGDVIVYFDPDNAPTPTPSPTPIPVGNADIHLWKVLGAGEVYVWKNDIDIGRLNLSENSETFSFNMGDSYKFVAIPKIDWVFEKYCTSDNCTTPWYDPGITSSHDEVEYSGIINQTTSNLYVYFKPDYLNITLIRASGDGKVEAYKNMHVNDGLTDELNRVNSRFAAGEQFEFRAIPFEGEKFIKYCTSYPCSYGKTFTDPIFKGMTNGNNGTLYVYFTGKYALPGYIKPVSNSDNPMTQGANLASQTFFDFSDDLDKGTKTIIAFIIICVGAIYIAYKSKEVQIGALTAIVLFIGFSAVGWIETWIIYTAIVLVLGMVFILFLNNRGD